MRPISRLLIAAFTLTVSTAGCTLYKTGDRESFNANAVAGAPRRSGDPELAAECARGRQADAEAIGAWNERNEIIHLENGTRVLIAKRLMPLERGLALFCRFALSPGDLASAASLDEFIAAAREQAERRVALEADL